MQLMYKGLFFTFFFILLLFSCKSDGDKSISFEEQVFEIVDFLDNQGELCSPNDTIYFENRILIKGSNKSIFHAQIIKKTFYTKSGKVVRFIESGFLDYPRKYNCVHSILFNHQSSTKLLVEFWDYLDLKDKWFPGKDDAEQSQRNFLIEHDNYKNMKFIDEDIGLRIETE